MTSGTALWTAPVSGVPTSLIDGRVEVQNSSGLVTLDQTGTIESNTSLATSVSQIAAANGASRFGVSTNSVLVAVSGGLLPNPFSAFAVQSGNLRGQDASEKIFVDNREGSGTVMLKLEEGPNCQVDNEPFRFIPPGQDEQSVYRFAVDGIKPPGWEPRGAGPYSQDWYKITNASGVEDFFKWTAHSNLPAGHFLGTCGSDGSVLRL